MVALTFEFVVAVLLVACAGCYRIVWDHLHVYANCIGVARALGYRLHQCDIMDTSKSSPCCIFQVHPPGTHQLAFIQACAPLGYVCFVLPYGSIELPYGCSQLPHGRCLLPHGFYCAPVRELTSYYLRLYTPWVRERS